MVQMFSRSYYAASATEFLMASPAASSANLSPITRSPLIKTSATHGKRRLSTYRRSRNDLRDSFFFLGFAIPRMGKRADAIVVPGGHIFVIEYKVDADDYEKCAIDQARCSRFSRWPYPVLLFHAATT